MNPADFLTRSQALTLMLILQHVETYNRVQITGVQVVPAGVGDAGDVSIAKVMFGNGKAA